MQYKDYYKVLGVARDARPEAIKKAYRLLARKYHPDVSREPNAEERFKEVQEAYEVLKDREKRAAYDQLGSWQPGQEFRPPPDWDERFGETRFEFRPGEAGFSDFFSELFGGRHRGARGAFAMRGQDIDATVELTLQQALTGTEASFRLAVPEWGQDARMRAVERSVKVRIPRGVTDGEKLRVPGKGGHGAGGGPPGDLYLNVVFRPDPLFRTSGHDAYLEVPLSPWEAALGADIEIPTLEGKARLKVPAGSRAGQKLRLAGKGLPRPGGRGHGDLYAVIQIAVPPAPSARERELFEELARVSRYDPRSHFRGG
ncbi:MAG: DnaJ C-terminal domain-containing protein [Rhodocyclaceae bacterium]